jgi:hypothetical protein
MKGQKRGKKGLVKVSLTHGDSRSTDLKMNKRTVICCLLALCSVTVLAAPTECASDNNSIDGGRSRFWPDFSIIARYINPFDWIGKPTLPKPKRYDWAFEKDSKSTPTL